MPFDDEWRTELQRASFHSKMLTMILQSVARVIVFCAQILGIYISRVCAVGDDEPDYFIVAGSWAAKIWINVGCRPGHATLFDVVICQGERWIGEPCGFTQKPIFLQSLGILGKFFSTISSIWSSVDVWNGMKCLLPLKLLSLKLWIAPFFFGQIGYWTSPKIPFRYKAKVHVEGLSAGGRLRLGWRCHNETFGCSRGGVELGRCLSNCKTCQQNAWHNESVLVGIHEKIDQKGFPVNIYLLSFFTTTLNNCYLFHGGGRLHSSEATDMTALPEDRGWEGMDSSWPRQIFTKSRTWGSSMRQTSLACQILKPQRHTSCAFYKSVKWKDCVAPIWCQCSL